MHAIYSGRKRRSPAAGQTGGLVVEIVLASRSKALAETLAGSSFAGDAVQATDIAQDGASLDEAVSSLSGVYDTWGL